MQNFIWKKSTNWESSNPTAPVKLRVFHYREGKGEMMEEIKLKKTDA